jgi:hypothetical protein
LTRPCPVPCAHPASSAPLSLDDRPGSPLGTRTNSELTKLSDFVPTTIAYLNIQFIVARRIEKAAVTTVQPLAEPGKSRQPEIRDFCNNTLSLSKYPNLLLILNQAKEKNICFAGNPSRNPSVIAPKFVGGPLRFRRSCVTWSSGSQSPCSICADIVETGK